MKKILLFFAILFSSVMMAQNTAITINEINADNPGGGGPGGGTDPAEFVELFGPANQSLDGLVLVFFNGFTGFGANAVPDSLSYAAYDLDGYSTDAQGFFVLGSATVTNVDMLFLNATNNIQNGADAIALYVGDAIDFPNGTAATSVNLVDAVVYGTADPTANSLVLALDLDFNVPGYFQQDETVQQGGTGADLTLSRIPDGGIDFDTSYVLQALTPGTWNLPPCAGGLVYLSDSTTALSTCDTQAGILSWTGFAGLGNSLAVITDANGLILATVSDTTFDFTGWSGNYSLQYLAYTNNLDYSTVEIGDPIAQVATDQCFSWSNAITLSFNICSGCVGGSVSSLAGASNVSIPLDGTADILNLVTTSTSLTASYQYALMDASGLFLQWIDPSFDFNTLNTGIYLVMGVSFEGNIVTDLVPGSNYSSFVTDLCSAWSDNVMLINVVTIPNVVINELNADNPGGPDTQEFVELYGDPNTPLDNLVAVFFNGLDGLSYAAYDLDGYSLDANGFFVIGDAATSNVDLVIPNGSLQNGADAVAIFVGDSIQFLQGTAAHSIGLVDAVVYGTADASADNLITGLGLDISMPGYTQLDETAQQTGIDLTLSRVPDGGIAFDYLSFVLQELTPGTFNIVILGCADLTACNYNSAATVNDGSCLYPGGPCDDGDATTINDVVDANCNCAGTLGTAGCMDGTACNYDANAVIDDGSCLFVGQICDDGDSTTTNDMIDANCACTGTVIIGVSELDDVNRWTIYPVPAANDLNIQFQSTKQENLLIRVYNLQGAVVKNTTWKVTINRNLLTLDVSDLNAGVYLIKVDDSEGTVIQSNVVID
jgi:Secretion system C-terminal sorting domain